MIFRDAPGNIEEKELRRFAFILRDLDLENLWLSELDFEMNRWFGHANDYTPAEAGFLDVIDREREWDTELTQMVRSELSMDTAT